MKRRLKKNSHHLWRAERSDDGRISVRRESPEPEDFAIDQQAVAKEGADVCAAVWGLWGASLVDDNTLNSEIPRGVANRFNVAAKKLGGSAPRVYTWSDLEKAFGDKLVKMSRQSIVDGMRVRVESKYLGLPFLMTAEILDQFSDLDHSAVRQIVSMIKDGDRKNAVAEYGMVAHRVAKVVDHYKDSGHKLAVDEKAKNYFNSYFGPYGDELVAEIKKRVRADLAKAWLKKGGVEEKAANLWSAYYGAHGSDWVKIVPGLISPSSR